MKKLYLLVLSCLVLGPSFAFDCPVTPAGDLADYYASIDGTSGKQLLDSIQQVAKIGYRSIDFRYDSVWLAFKYTDIRPDGLIWEIYSDCNFEYEKDRTSTTSQTGECKGYNREHAMCQSWFSEYDLQGVKMTSSKKNSPGSDIFHIYPASYGMNSRRGNRPMGEVQRADNTSGNGTKYGTPVTTKSVANSVAGAYVEGNITVSTNVLEPADEYKGDIARSYFGTMVKWAGEWAFNKNELGNVIFDATIDADTHYGPENNYGFTDYGLALMLSWHRQDPVSQKEVDRNNGIQKTQGNRNPFIDYPYLAEFIWGERSGEMVNMDDLLCSSDARFELDESNGYLGGEIQVITDTVFWMVGDELYTTTVVKEGAKLKALPEAPASCSSNSATFMGWTSKPMLDISNNAPDILYTKVADFPAININTLYYAVFAQEQHAEIAKDVIRLDKNDSTRWTITDVKQTSNKTDGAYWLLVKDASITSPVIDLQMLDSVTMNLRTYQKKSTVSIAVNGNEIGKVTATINSMQHYVWNVPQLTGNHSLTFTGADATASYGVGLNEIVLYLGGEESTYTNYLTHCMENTTGMQSLPVQTQRCKILRDGKLYIHVGENVYDSMGRVVK